MNYIIEIASKKYLLNRSQIIVDTIDLCMAVVNDGKFSIYFFSWKSIL